MDVHLRACQRGGLCHLSARHCPCARGAHLVAFHAQKGMSLGDHGFANADFTIRRSVHGGDSVMLACQAPWKASAAVPPDHDLPVEHWKGTPISVVVLHNEQTAHGLIVAVRVSHVDAQASAPAAVT